MNNKKNDIWISMSDIMTALMMVFLFISISYMRIIENEKNEIKEIALTWEISQNEIYESLKEEFKKDLIKWDAEIEKENLTIRFKEPSVLFKVGESTLTEDFEIILVDFLPRYQKILNEYTNEINNVRIEGHTSSDWGYFEDNEAYMENMKLSQERTQSVLNFWIYNIKEDSLSEKNKWVKKFVEAVGKSSSKTILNEFNEEDKKKSRRVEFKVKTKTEQKIMKILEK